MSQPIASLATLSLPSWFTATTANHMLAAMTQARRDGRDPAAAARDAAQAMMPAYPWPVIEEAARWAQGLRAGVWWLEPSAAGCDPIPVQGDAAEIWAVVAGLVRADV